jgi:hypothetical protein
MYGTMKCGFKFKQWWRQTNDVCSHDEEAKTSRNYSEKPV